ncbi:MAG TPA: FAD-dependent oxidoreductase [Ferruginibacter sp.]|nr:FAD-dependent oxidoreductase [Ferruginibacter sp.]
MNLRSGYPFWLAKNGLPFDYPKLERSMRCDVVIMGGGISGALVAYQLINAGVDCMVVDARTIGLGSTCASTSLLQYEIDTPLSELKDKIGLKNAVRSYQLCVEAIIKLGKIAKEIKFADFEFKESLYYAAYKKDLSFLKEEFNIRKEQGFDVDYLDEKTVKKQFHFEASGAILSAMAAQTNAYGFTHALLQVCKGKGMKIFDRTPIVKIGHHKNGVTLITETGLTLKTKKLVYATGYEAVEFIDKKIVDLHCTFACTSEQANEKEKFWKDDVLMWNTADPYFYMRSTKDRRILIGGRDEEFYGPAKRAKLLPAKVKQLVKDFNKVFPGIAFKPEFSWAGTFGATKDGLPFIGNYKKLPNSLFALGFGGNGITFSLTAAELLTDMITGRKNRDAGIFSFERL